MTNSSYENVQPKKSFKTNYDNNRTNSRGRFSGNRDGGGFRIKLSDNEMKAVKSIQEKFKLKSTVAVLGFSLRTLSEMIKDEKLINDINKYAKDNKNASAKFNPKENNRKIKDAAVDPFARPVKSQKNDEGKNNIDNLLDEK